MFSKTSLVWVKPENRTLVLTYDDGPGQIEAGPGEAGPRTLELAEYLHYRGICATFFMIGKHAESHRNILKELANLGHLIGNHTYSHPAGDKTGWSGANVDHRKEITRTHEIIKPYVAGKFFFRAPGGAGWPDATPYVVDTLNNAPELREYIGPVGWNIESQDCAQWQAAADAKKAAAHIQSQITNNGGCGIILMHDCSTDQERTLRENNRALDVAKLLVPKLSAAGYQFKRLDEVSLTTQ